MLQNFLNLANDQQGYNFFINRTTTQPIKKAGFRQIGSNDLLHSSICDI